MWRMYLHLSDRCLFLLRLDTADISKYVKADMTTGQWNCLFCAAANFSDAFKTADRSSSVELTSRTVQYRDT